MGSLALATAAPAFAGITLENEHGRLGFGGDIELDINAQNSQQGPIFYADDLERSDDYDQSGRFLLDISGERSGSHGHYAHFRAQPLLQTNGGFGMDDAWLALGHRNGTELKVGRFEAFDLFPLGQDVFVGYSGDTSDGLYADGQGYVYQAKEGRGRAGDSGQVMISRQFGNLYGEIATLFGDRSDLFDGDTYHGYRIEESKNSFIVRPVLAWSAGPWTLAGGVEANLAGDALVDERGQDISDRTGYGTRLSYARGPWSINANLAYLDAHEEDNLTLGLNALWHNVGIGYIHARNEIDDVKPGSEGTLTEPGRYSVDTLYTSYRFPDVLGIRDLDVYLGAYYSRVDHREVDNLDDADRYGGRLRFKYHF